MAIINTKKTIDFNNKVWSTGKIINDYPWSLVCVTGKDIVFEGNEGGVDTYSNIDKTQFNSLDCYSQTITVDDGGDLTIKGGKYLAPSTVVYVYEGTCTIEGGFFCGQPDAGNKAKTQDEIDHYDGCPYRNFTINCMDANYKKGIAKIIIKGGKFAGFDPGRCWAEAWKEEDKNCFLADGYESVRTDETYTYTVKDTARPDCGQLITVPVWEVRPVNAE